MSVTSFSQFPRNILLNIASKVTDKRALAATSSLFRQIVLEVMTPSKALPEITIWPSIRNDLQESLLPGPDFEGLDRKGISLETLKKMREIESSVWGSIRWINIDHLIEKVLHYLMLKESDVRPSFKSDDHLWISGRGLPLNNKSALQRAYGATGFRQGVEFILSRGTHYTLYSILAYQIITNIQEGNLNSLADFVQIFRSADDKAFTALFLFPEAKEIVSAALALPFVWGVIKGFINAREARPLTDQTLSEFADYFANFSKGFRNDVLRWVLPLHPADRYMNQLERRIRWDGRLTLEQREAAFLLLQEIAEKHGGYTKIAALHLLAKIAHGHSFKQLALLKSGRSEEVQLQLLKIKTKAFELINLSAPSLKTAFLKDGFSGLNHAFYAHYLKWTLANSDSRAMSITMLALKTIKIGIGLSIFVTLFNSIISYLKCPNRQGFTLQGGYPSSSYLYTEECFNGYVTQFNSFPGQPVETLTRLIPQSSFIGNYTLDLSGKGLNGNVTAHIINALIQNHVHLIGLNLSGNAINTVQDVNFLFQSLPTYLTLLDLSFNRIEYIDSQATQAIGNELSVLRALTLLNLSNNRMGYHNSDGTQAIGNSLPALTALTALDLSINYIGYRDSNGSQAIGTSLSSLTALTSLDLSHNDIGNTDSNGTQAIGHSLSALRALTSLDLSNNGIGFRDLGMHAIGNSLSALSALTSLDLSNNGIGDYDSSSTQEIGNSLRALTALTSLDLSGNSIGNTDSNGTQVIGNSLSALTALTSLDLSGNFIGKTGSDGTQAIAEALPSLRHLQYIGVTPIYIGVTPIFNGNGAQLTQVIQQLHLRNDLPIFNSPTEAESYLAALPADTTVIDFSGKLGGISIETYTIILQGLTRFTNLKQLGFSNNFAAIDIPDSLSQIIENSLSALTTLTSLDLSGNQIGVFNNPGTQAIVNTFRFLTALTSLDLSSNQMGSQSSFGTRAIVNSLGGLTALTSLDLSGNFIGYSDSLGTQAIGNLLPALVALKSLDLSNNYIGETDSLGTQVVGSSLSALTALTSLDLSTNAIGFKDNLGILAISRSLPKLVRLNNLDLSNDNIGSTGPEGPLALLNVLPGMKQLKFIGLTPIANTSWPEGAAAIARVTDSALNDACQGQLCFGRNLTISHLSTSAGSRLSPPLYLRIPAQLSVWAINSLRQEAPKLSGTNKEPATASTPRLVSVCQAVVGGAVMLYLANRVKNHLLSWWNGTTEVVAQEPHAPQELFERRIKTFDSWLDSLKIAFQRIHDQNRIPEYESKWYLSSVENYQDDIVKLQAKGGATRKELHELSLDIKALHKEAIAQIKAA